MPNHVTSRCVITGPAEEVARFRAKMIVSKVEQREPFWPADRVAKTYVTFDFEAIIPMPASIKDVDESTLAEDGMALIQARGSLGGPFATYGLYEARLSWIRREAGLSLDAHVADVAAAFLTKHPEYEAAGAARMRALLETGYASWYPWSIKHWGTKWGAYDFELVADEPLTIKFETAWDFPTPVFNALIVEFPTLSFDCICFDEGWNFGGEGIFSAEASTFQTAKAKATDDLYERVYLRAPERDEDEAEV